MTSHTPARRSAALPGLAGALAVTAVMITTAIVLWLQLGTLDPGSADIGGGPIGALSGGAVGAVLGAVDVARRGWHLARPAWTLVGALTGVTVLVLLVVRGGLDPFLPVAALLVAVLLLAPVVLGLLLGHAVHVAREKGRTS